MTGICRYWLIIKIKFFTLKLVIAWLILRKLPKGFYNYNCIANKTIIEFGFRMIAKLSKPWLVLTALVFGFGR